MGVTKNKPCCSVVPRLFHKSTQSTAPTSGKYSGNTSGRYHFSFTAVSQSPYRAPTKSPLSAHKVPTPRPRSWRAPTKSPPLNWRKINEKSKAPTKSPPLNLVRGERPQSPHPEDEIERLIHNLPRPGLDRAHLKYPPLEPYKCATFFSCGSRGRWALV